MFRYIEEHKDRFGVEPICRQLQIAPSTYYELRARERDPERVPARHRRDGQLCSQIQRVWQENFRAYGARKVWKQLNREQIPVAHCTVRRLMRKLGLRGATRGKAFKVTTVADQNAPRPADLVERSLQRIFYQVRFIGRHGDRLQQLHFLLALVELAQRLFGDQFAFGPCALFSRELLQQTVLFR